MKRIAILGSTGSIGQSALDVVRRLPGEFEVIGLSTNSRIDVLYQQIKRFSPRAVAVGDIYFAKQLKSRLNSGIELFEGEEGINQLLEDRRIDLVVLAISGACALAPLMKAIERGIDVALANKEALVMAGNIIMQKAKQKKVNVLPIDSEQSAIWQCLEQKERKALKKIYLTASGGPLLDFKAAEFKKVTLKKVLRHPRWQMGQKVTVDSATLMNKGLELIEAMRLFNVEGSQIEIIIHPEAVIHSMVEFIDGSILAQLSVTDMRIPIQYALTYPKRCANNLPSLDFFKLRSLSFYKPDFKKFPCLRLAQEAARTGGSLPCALNASNEVAVEAFLGGRIDFLTIPKVIEKVLGKHRVIARPNLEDIFQTNTWARLKAREYIDGFARG